MGHNHRRYCDLQHTFPPTGTWLFVFPSPQPPKSHSLQVVIGVDPNFFYRSLLATFDAPHALDLAKEAPALLLDSAYIIFIQSLPLEE